MSESSGGPARPALAGLRAVLSALERVTLGAAAACVLALILMTAADVLGRYALGRPLGWAYDASLVLMIGLCFLSIASVQAKRQHVAVLVLYQGRPPLARLLLTCLHFATGIFAFGLIGWKNLEYAAEAARSGWVYGGFGAIPTWLPYGFIGAGSVLLTLRLAVQWLAVLLEGRGSALLGPPQDPAKDP